jgi:hypothetical protein
MRTLLLAAFSLSSLTASQQAEACGQPEPHVFRLASYFIVSVDDANARRTFVLRPGEKVPSEGLEWDQISPRSYDMTEIAAALDFFQPATFTLVGPSGTKVVTTSKHFFLARTFEFKNAVGALEVDAGEGFSIALSGKHANARWSELDNLASSKANAKWITAHGVTQPDSIYVSRVKGTDIETLSVFPKGGTKMITFVKQGDKDLGHFEGSPLGSFTVDGISKLVMVDGEKVVTAYLN